MWEEIGYDFSINSDIDHPNDNNSSYRCNKKPRPELRGYFTNADRVTAFTKCAQVITLRTQLMPTVFEGNPTAVSIASGKQLRTVQWGNDVFAAANFDASATQAVTLPSGTWYDYLNGGNKANGTYSLKPGELKVFTGSQVIAPTFADIQKRDHSDIEQVETVAPQGYKFIQNGQLFIQRGDKVYTITGQPVR